ncbi:MAG: hypothetical protein FWC50_12570 [Planctomycetaceae bacterium]|nr:hypothetical protein [Planctomycetaceae bacterium]
MKRLLLLGTLLVAASFATGCACCGFQSGVCSQPMMGCSSCQETCPTCPTGCGLRTHYQSPYAGQYYAGGECGSSCGGCGSCGGGCGGGSGRILFSPLGCLFHSLCGTSDCGCDCEVYYGDYINNRASCCEPCDQYGNLGGYTGGCASGTCGDVYSAPPVMSPMAQPVSQPMVVPQPGCKSCGQGNTFYTSGSTPVMQQVQPQNQMVPVRQNRMIALQQANGFNPQMRQIVLQDKVIGGQQQGNPIRQVSGQINPQNQRIVQSASMTNSSNVVYSR